MGRCGGSTALRYISTNRPDANESGARDEACSQDTRVAGSITH